MKALLSRSMLKAVANVGFVGLAAATALPAHADPYSLVAYCRLTSIRAGKATCQLDASLQDNDPNDTKTIRKVQLRVDNVLVAQANNDVSNPVDFFSSYAGTTGLDVACGASHEVTAWLVAVGQGNYVEVGNVPAVVCPKAP